MDTIDFAKLGQKRPPASRQQSKRNPRVPSAVRVGSQVSAHNYRHDGHRYNLPSARLPNVQQIGRSEQHSRQPSGQQERSYERPPMNPRSADVYKAKSKKYYSQCTSDHEDASTSVSSRSQIRRNHINSLHGGPYGYKQPHHGQHASQTPQAIPSSKAHDLNNYLPNIVEKRDYDYEP